MNTAQNICLPRFVVFEGVDGSGKTTLAHALTNYYSITSPHRQIYANSFPGSIPGTLGEWVYRLHHNKLPSGDLSPTAIAPPALQLLHVAAHIDTILTHITPTLHEGGLVILDRYWWSTYSYSRLFLPVELVWPLVNAERTFLAQLSQQPTIIYLTRKTSLKQDEISSAMHTELDLYYHEIVEKERSENVPVYEVSNDGPVECTWMTLLDLLGLPYQPLS